MWLLFAAVLFSVVSAVIWLYRPPNTAEAFLLRRPTPSDRLRALALTCAANPRGGKECCWLRDGCSDGEAEACAALQLARETATARGHTRHPLVVVQ